MARNVALALFAALLVASAAQAASIGGGTEGAGEGFTDEMKEQLNANYELIQQLVGQMQSNPNLALDARAHIWAQLDKLEDMWRSTSAEEHAQMPAQMLVVRDAANDYAAAVQSEEQSLSVEQKESAEKLVAVLKQLAAAMESSSQAVAAAIEAAQKQLQEEPQAQQQEEEPEAQQQEEEPEPQQQEEEPEAQQQEEEPEAQQQEEEPEAQQQEEEPEAQQQQEETQSQAQQQQQAQKLTLSRIAGKAISNIRKLLGIIASG